MTAVKDSAPAKSPTKTIVLVGLMGAGTSCIGKRLAHRLGLAFVDADHEVERAAGCSIAEIFARHGEANFRDGERRVIARLLDNPVHVLATGGGAFMDPRTRALIGERAISIWLPIKATDGPHAGDRERGARRLRQDARRRVARPLRQRDDPHLPSLTRRRPLPA